MFRKYISSFRPVGGIDGRDSQQTVWQGATFWKKDFFEFLEADGKSHWAPPEEYMKETREIHLPFYRWLKKNNIQHAIVWEISDEYNEFDAYDLFFEVTDPNQAMLARLMWG